MPSSPLTATLRKKYSKKYNSLPNREATNRLQDLRPGNTLREAEATVETYMTHPQPS
jgi:hypothetical protein